MRKKETLGAERAKITYSDLFWIFLVGSVLGLICEGLWCLIKYDVWETHVTTMWFPMCCIYGIGAAGCYVGCVLLQRKPFWLKFIVFSIVGAGVELICGLVLEFGLGMRAWDYRGSFLNIRGHVNLEMTLIWGVMGIAFGLVVPALQRVFSKMQGKFWKILCLILTVFVAIDLAFTAVCIVRWKNRHLGLAPANAVTRFIDSRYPDEFMSKRFCEWHFINK